MFNAQPNIQRARAEKLFEEDFEFKCIEYRKPLQNYWQIPVFLDFNHCLTFDLFTPEFLQIL